MSRANLARRAARADRPTSAYVPPEPVWAGHPCWCDRAEFSADHQLGDHPSFWENPPKQGLRST